MWIPNDGLHVYNMMIDEVERRKAYKREVCCFFFETQSSPHPKDSLDSGVDHHLAVHLPVDSRHLSGCQ